MSALQRALPAVLALAAAGCGEHSYSAAMEERTKAQEEFLGILRTIKDPASMQAASDTLARSFERLAQTNSRMNKMHPPNLEVKERLAKDYGPRLQAALSASLRELGRIGDLPGGQEFIDRLKNMK